jgi:hypothetical protein
MLRARRFHLVNAGGTRCHPPDPDRHAAFAVI